ncbi:MAG TPA: group 1 truncated hemoglobin, partial [Thermoanaerobaculia bacterium]|nr:group 1 truncated hemoglobin [Thermoanaerobaculia bacterium]
MIIGRRFLSIALGLLFVSAWALAQAKPAQPAPSAPAAPSLYKRLGGYDAIAAVTDEFIAQFAADKQLNRFLVGLSDSSKGRLRQLVVEQICQATGGPCVYIGRDTKTAHKGLGITVSDWDLSVQHLVAALEKFKVPQKEKDDLLAIVA